MAHFPTTAADNAAPAWGPVVEQLHQHFNEMAQPCLLWIDPARSDPFDGDPLVAQRRVRTPIVHPRFDTQLAPYMVELDLARSADADVLRASVELAWKSWAPASLNALLGQPVCGWVSTRAGAATVTAYWAGHCYLHPQRGYAKLLRFHDPSVREWLWAVLDASQQQLLLGAVDSIYSIGRAQTLVQQRVVLKDGQVRPPPVPAARFVLNERQWDDVDDYAVLHAAWLAWCGRRGSVSAQPENWQRAVLDTLREATRLGLKDAVDRELFAVHVLQAGPYFYKHGQLQDVWKRTMAGEFYGSALEEVTGKPPDQLHNLFHPLHDTLQREHHG